MKFLSIILTVCVFFASIPCFYAQTKNPHEFRIISLVNKKGKPSESASKLIFEKNSLKIIKRGTTASFKEFSYSEIKQVEYSHKETPFFSKRDTIALTALATATFAGFAVIPLMFLKKKQHWISLRTDEDFAVFHLSRKNLKYITAEFESRNIVVAIGDENNYPK